MTLAVAFPSVLKLKGAFLSTLQHRSPVAAKGARRELSRQLAGGQAELESELVHFHLEFQYCQQKLVSVYRIFSGKKKHLSRKPLISCGVRDGVTLWAIGTTGNISLVLNQL